ncbi:protein of unknown function DUF1552 [Chthoniobacter flavus Ellin428]|uniref:Tat (Twin-arginine translocation) pathway signal sequence domain protein n=1 Tax=Chthoniobacter flavus Ellin428 TaxID=497964 RepID=B4D144_9BACT|nr:DUF1552 domain-containing protein [Chthoniobacter flavus]EDY20056.1 protein of unknown function DUF1552 [Chthoniobacter flavus Ellin428]TCO93953.1 uncharacterized protein DUF1552 [Chthoniobacter flavus]
MSILNRRQFLRQLGVSSAALPFLAGLPSLMGASTPQSRQRVIIMFSPNGTLPNEFWPDAAGELAFKPIMEPLNPFKDRTLVVDGICNKIRGDGDNHMRGMSCLLTANELLPGNIRGGGGTPAGWASSISIDQEIKNFLQGQKDTRTRFGSLEFGVAVPDRADPWTRMSYAGANQPVAPIDNPYQMFGKMYGRMKDRDNLVSILDDVREDLTRVSAKLSARDKALLDQHVTIVRNLEQDLKHSDKDAKMTHPMPELDPSVELVNDNTPQISRMQIDLLVNSLANDMTRVATLQYMRSVGQAQMRWLGIQEGHHSLSHEPDTNQDSYAKLKKINTWFAGELAYLAKRLAETPEPSGEGSMLDHTLIVWTNELGKGNTHALDNIPCVMIGGAPGFKMGRSVKLDKTPHNRLWLTLAHAMGHTQLETFGKADLCAGGPLSLA